MYRCIWLKKYRLQAKHSCQIIYTSADTKSSYILKQCFQGGETENLKLSFKKQNQEMRQKEEEQKMLYFILLVLAAWMIVMGTRANILNLEVANSAIQSDNQHVIWHEMGGLNILLLEYGPNMPLSFISGVGILIAYIGLWRCVLGSWNGMLMVILGVAVCAAVQFTMIAKIKTFFKEFEETYKTSASDIFCGKNGLAHAIYTSIMIGIGKMVKFVLIVSVVGILLYVLLRQAILNGLNIEEKLISGEAFEFPPRTIYDENENPWILTEVMGEDKNIRIYDNPADRNASKVYINVDNLQHEIDQQGIAGLQVKLNVGEHTFHWN